jgi:predicted dithiol-disulfide oxidoreductase (DUF899 family)
MFLIARRAQGLASWTVKSVEGETYVPRMHRKYSRIGRRSWIDGRTSGGLHRQIQRVFQSESFQSVSEMKGENQMAMNTPPIVSKQEWEAAREQLLAKEKALTRSRDALAAERRRMPWMAVEKAYEFEGPKGKVNLLDLFEGRRQLIVYRAFFEPGVLGWPEHACPGCSLGADQVGHLAHLNARDTTLVWASRAPQKDIERLKVRMGWKMPWYTIVDSFDKDFGVDQWHGHNVFFRDGDKVFRTYLINSRGDEAMGSVWSYLDVTPLGRQETWEDSPEGYPQTPPYRWWKWHDKYDVENGQNPKWLDMITDPEGAAARRREEEVKGASRS